MCCGTKVPFVRHSVQRQRQSFLDKRPRLCDRPCKNRRSSVVPDQHRLRPPHGRRHSLQDCSVGVRERRNPPRGGHDRPARHIGGDRPTAVPDHLHARRQRLWRYPPTGELPGLAADEDLIAVRGHAGSAHHPDEGLARPQPCQQRVQPLASRQPVSAPGTDERGGKRRSIEASIRTKPTLPRGERD